MATKVRYVSSTSGINVRSTAAGAKIATLNYGDLMYDVPGVATQTASLGDTSYEWVKVHYYPYGTSTSEGEGWVTVSNTTVVSTVTPTKSKVLNSNYLLKQHERLINARYIHKYLKDNGWSNNAIYAMLGNMEEESSINPGKWEVTNNTSKGYGLTQWSPSTKYTSWLPTGSIISDIDNQLARILYEVLNDNLQWVKSQMSPNMTFSEFTTSNKSVSVLAEYFLRCYERPSDAESKVATRQANAAKWKTLIEYLT